MNTRATTDMDRMIGQRIRLARKMAKLSQTKLAQGLGITYQQVQKYENGTDRISAGRLYMVTHITDQPISFFYGEAEGEDAVGNVDVLADPHMQKLIASAAGIQNRDMLFQLASVAETFAAAETQE